MKNKIIGLVTLLFLVSCGETALEDRLITKETIKQDFEELKQANQEMDSFKIRFVESFIGIVDGRDAYLDVLAEGDLSEKAKFDKYVVPEEQFNNAVDTIFAVFASDKLTYRMLFAELDSLQAFSDNFEKEKLMPVYERLNDECLRRQALADLVSNSTDEQLDSLAQTDIDFGFLTNNKDSITGFDLKLSMNFNYKTPEKLFGFCPYVSPRSPIANEIRMLKAERQEYAKNNFKLFDKYNDNYMLLFLE